MWTEEINLQFQKHRGKSWKRIIDTQSYFETNFNFWSDDDAETMTEPPMEKSLVDGCLKGS